MVIVFKACEFESKSGNYRWKPVKVFITTNSSTSCGLWKRTERHFDSVQWVLVTPALPISNSVWESSFRPKNRKNWSAVAKYKKSRASWAAEVSRFKKCAAIVVQEQVLPIGAAADLHHLSGTCELLSQILAPFFHLPFISFFSSQLLSTPVGSLHLSCTCQFFLAQSKWAGQPYTPHWVPDSQITSMQVWNKHAS